ncbi:CxxxxCH/CxxCH domain c-type cytochrome [Geotalea uraniireducens]|nr:CxxxxCH/CxxCH domain-containing protein [Geotalea uraniireducens]
MASLVSVLLLATASAGAAIQCYDCHGDRIGPDYRPRDAAYRNLSTGGFVGSHRTHLTAAALPGNCTPCHGDAAAGYTTSHRNSAVELAANINNSPKAGGATYSKGTSFAQSASPTPGTCSNVNCHFESLTPSWGATPLSYTTSTTNDCSKCHGVAPATGSHPISGAKHAAYYGTDTGSCLKCHPDHTVEAAPFAHATSAGKRDLALSFAAAPNDGTGSYSGPLNDYLPSQSNSYGSCSSLYCHSPGTKASGFAAPNQTATWGGSLGCNGCHKGDLAGTGDPMASGSHTAHVSGDRSAYKCVKCHAATVTGATTIGTVGNHVNKLVNVAFDNSTTAVGGTYAGVAAPLTKAPGSGYGSCTNVYCHSTVQPDGGVGVPVYQTTTAWGASPGNNCGTCHADGSSHMGAGTMATGSHTRHLAYTLDTASASARCAICHNIGGGTFTNGASCNDMSCHQHKGVVDKHADHNIDVIIAGFFGGTYNGSSQPGSGYSTCTNVYCHSDGQATPTYAPAVTWGSGALTCSSCHGSATANGPGGTALSGKHAAHVNNAAVFGTNNSLGCVECHRKTVSDSTTLNATTGTTYHVNKFVDYTGVKAGGAARYNTGTKQCSNIYCHSNGNPGSLVYANPAAWTSATTYGCNGCHGTGNATGAPDYTNGGAGTTTANSHPIHVSGLAITTTVGCATCHRRTADANTAGKFRNYSTQHLNRAVDVDFLAPVSVTFSGGSCSSISCHGGTSATWGGTACLECHSVSQGNRAAITAQFSANSHHIQGTLDNSKCYQCHWEANADGTINPTYHGGSLSSGAPVNLVIQGTLARPTTYTEGVTGVAYTADGTRTQLAKINGHCLSCHDAANATYQPFGDGKTPQQYAWDGKSIDERYSQTGTTTWGKYASPATVAPKSVTKAFSAHGNAANNARGWDTTNGVDGAITNTSGGTNVLCFDCHNSHGSTVAGTTTSYASATTNGGILKDTVNGKGGYTATYKPAAGGTTTDHDVYNAGAGLCFDCHQNAAASSTLPWGYGTYGATKAILGYWDTSYFGKAGGTFPSTQRYTFKATRATNMGGHFGHSTMAMSGAGITMATTPLKQINGLCTPCHDPHGVSPSLGTNEQYAVPLLKGTWLTSLWKEDAAPSATNEPRGYSTPGSTPGYHVDQNSLGVTNSAGGAPSWNKADANRVTQTDSQFAGLCLGCHTKAALAPKAGTSVQPDAWKSVSRIHGAVKGWATTSATYDGNANNAMHSFTCSKCHTPHNSRLPRLMVSNCLDANHRGRVSSGGTFGSGWGYDNTGPGAGGGQGPGGGGGDGFDPYRPNPWFFGANPPSQSQTANIATCHNVPNAAGSGTANANQLWNAVTPW